MTEGERGRESHDDLLCQKIGKSGALSMTRNNLGKSELIMQAFRSCPAL